MLGRYRITPRFASLRSMETTPSSLRSTLAQHLRNLIPAAALVAVLSLGGIVACSVLRGEPVIVDPPTVVAAADLVEGSARIYMGRLERAGELDADGGLLFAQLLGAVDLMRESARDGVIDLADLRQATQRLRGLQGAFREWADRRQLDPDAVDGAILVTTSALTVVETWLARQPVE